MDKVDYKSILAQNGFNFNKSLGQNFIFDENLLNAIVTDSGIGIDDTVVEIGVGAGSMTNILAQNCKKVIGYEIDKRLSDVHQKTLLYKNIEMHYQDFLKVSDDDLKNLGEYKVVANLPYYITTPIIFRLLECNNPPSSITIMVQKEVADRIVARPATSDYGVLSVTVALHCTAKIIRKVPRTAFVPAPNVDSAIVYLNKNITPISNIPKISKLVKIAFSNRRKMLTNNLMQGYGITKDQAINAIKAINVKETIRGEILSMEQFVDLNKSLSDIIK